MPKSPEWPKKYTIEEMAEIEKSRTLSDAELLKGEYAGLAKGGGLRLGNGKGLNMRLMKKVKGTLY